jgi:cobalt-zinc-cadmium efflux system outer membrane protein
MKRLELYALFFAAWSAAAQPQPSLPAAVSLEEVLRIVSRSPRIVASEREAEAARAERVAAGALLNPTLSVGRSRPSGGERTVFDAQSQQQASVDVPIPVFGQRAAKMRAAERQVGRAESAIRLTQSEIRRQAALEYLKLLTAQEQLEARRAGVSEVQRIRELVSGRLASGMASRYDLARADAELALAGLGLQRAETEVAEHAAALAELADADGWRPRAAGSLQGLQAGFDSTSDAPAMLARNPALRVAREETALATARIEVANRERFPVPSVSLGRTWTSGPFGAANFVGLSSEIPILDDRRALEDKARAEAGAARERERGVNATLRAQYQRQRETLGLRRAALERFDKNVFERETSFREMAESAYRLGRGTLFELLDARRTQLEALSARLELLSAIIEAQFELRALSDDL